MLFSHSVSLVLLAATMSGMKLGHLSGQSCNSAQGVLDDTAEVPAYIIPAVGNPLQCYCYTNSVQLSSWASSLCTRS